MFLSCLLLSDIPQCRYCVVNDDRYGWKVAAGGHKLGGDASAVLNTSQRELIATVCCSLRSLFHFDLSLPLPPFLSLLYFP